MRVELGELMGVGLGSCKMSFGCQEDDASLVQALVPRDFYGALTFGPSRMRPLMQVNINVNSFF